jgi:hypothetical protein
MQPPDSDGIEAGEAGIVHCVTCDAVSALIGRHWQIRAAGGLLAYGDMYATSRSSTHPDCD